MTLKFNTLLYGIRHIIFLIIGVFFNLYITKIFTTYDFGILVLFNSFIGAFTFLTDGGLLVSFIQDKADLTEKSFNRILSFQTAIILFIFIIVILLYVLGFLIFLSTEIIILSTFIITTNTMLTSYYTKFQKELKVINFTIIDVLSNLIYYFVVILLAMNNYGFISIILGTLIRNIAGLLISFYYIRPFFKFEKFYQDANFLRNLKNGLIYQFSYVIGYIRSISTPLIVGHFLNISSIGIVDRTSFFAGQPNAIITLISQKIFFPYFSKFTDDFQILKMKIKESIMIISFLDKLYFIPLIILIEPFITKYLDESWLPLINFVIIVSVGNMLFGAFSAIIGVLVISLGLFKLNNKLNIIQLVIFIPLAFIATKYFGLLGFILMSPISWLGTFISLKYVKSELGVFTIAYEIFTPFILSIITILLTFLIKWFIRIDNLIVEVLTFTSISYILYILLFLIFDKRYFKSWATEFISFINKQIKILQP